MDTLEDKKSSNHNGATPVPRPVPERIDKSLQGQRPTTPRPKPSDAGTKRPTEE